MRSPRSAGTRKWSLDVNRTFTKGPDGTGDLTCPMLRHRNWEQVDHIFADGFLGDTRHQVLGRAEEPCWPLV